MLRPSDAHKPAKTVANRPNLWRKPPKTEAASDLHGSSFDTRITQNGGSYTKTVAPTPFDARIKL